MKRTFARAAWILLLASAVFGPPQPGAGAAEIRLRAESRPQGAIVTLGDLVELRSESSGETQRLAAITLFPAPAPGVERFVSAREIQDMLLVRGIDLAGHAFSGPASVRVRGCETAVRPAGGGQPAGATPAAKKTLEVAADQALQPLVVPVRSIPRGTRILAADVEVRRGTKPASAAAAVRPEEVVGKETNRALAAGEPIERAWLQPPLLVRRGDIVSVYVRAAGIRVRTQARARDDGAAGELVIVESPADRRSYLAHVSGVREVEVLATGVTARDSGLKSPGWQEE